MMPFGYDPEHPAPGVIRMVALGVALFAWITDNRALFLAAMVVGVSAMVVAWRQAARDHAAFEEHLRQYVAGERDDLPGDDRG